MSVGWRLQPLLTGTLDPCDRRAFYDQRMSAEVEGEKLGDEYKGYVFKITGGNDKEGANQIVHCSSAGGARVPIALRSGCRLPHEAGCPHRLACAPADERRCALRASWWLASCSC